MRTNRREKEKKTHVQHTFAVNAHTNGKHNLLLVFQPLVGPSVLRFTSTFLPTQQNRRRAATDSVYMPHVEIHHHKMQSTVIFLFWLTTSVQKTTHSRWQTHTHTHVIRRWEQTSAANLSTILPVCAWEKHKTEYLKNLQKNAQRGDGKSRRKWVSEAETDDKTKILFEIIITWNFTKSVIYNNNSNKQKKKRKKEMKKIIA